MFAPLLMTGLLGLTAATPQGFDEPARRPLFDPVTGTWRAWIAAQGKRIPFELELARDGDAWSGWVHNADERIELGDVSFDGTELVIRLDPYDSYLRAFVVNEGHRLKGQWERYRSPEETTRLDFGAIAGEAERFFVPVAEEPGGRSQHVGRWVVDFAESEDPAVAIFELMDDGRRTRGTFLTTLGDYRYLEGVFDGKSLFLSCFDGAHAFLFEASLQPDGSLAGNFWSRNTWLEGWTARKDPDAALPDPFELTKWTDAVPLAELAFPDLDGTRKSLADEAFAGKARMLVLFGTWCPNCHDESRYLAELHRRYAERGLSILGLAFEFGDDFERNARNVRHYAETLGIDYPILIAGTSDKGKASEAFPLLDRVRAYPTTVFLHGDGRLRALHTGFAGPATGAAHEKLREDFETLIEELLAEGE